MFLECTTSFWLIDEIHGYHIVYALAFSVKKPGLMLIRAVFTLPHMALADNCFMIRKLCS